MAGLITARELGRTSAKGADMKALIQEQLRVLDEALVNAKNQLGETSLTYNLPQVPQVRGLSVGDTQRVLYASIIQSLVQRGFKNVYIEFQPKRTFLYIEWESTLDREELESINLIIRRHTAVRDERGALKYPKTRKNRVGKK